MIYSYEDFIKEASQRDDFKKSKDAMCSDCVKKADCTLCTEEFYKLNYFVNLVSILDNILKKNRIGTCEKVRYGRELKTHQDTIVFGCVVDILITKTKLVMFNEELDKSIDTFNKFFKRVESDGGFNDKTLLDCGWEVYNSNNISKGDRRKMYESGLKNPYPYDFKLI
jgi:hypothetical protein